MSRWALAFALIVAVLAIVLMFDSGMFMHGD
jgi:hypothetical protein